MLTFLHEPPRFAFLMCSIYENISLIFFLSCAPTGGIVNNAIASIKSVSISLLAGIVLGFFVRYFPSEDQVYTKSILWKYSVRHFFQNIKLW